MVAGGTGLYIRAMLCGLFEESPSDPDLRRRLNAEAGSLGAPALHRRLAGIDPAAAGRIHPNDAYRIVRALEINQITGVPISRHHQAHRFADAPFRTLKIGLTMERPALYARIDRRVDAMVDQGLQEEVRRLLDMGYGPELKSMQSIGYRHMVDFFFRRLTWEEAIRTLKRDTRRFAKRQFTWFNADDAVNWFQPARISDMIRAAKAFLGR